MIGDFGLNNNVQEFCFKGQQNFGLSMKMGYSEEIQ